MSTLPSPSGPPSPHTDRSKGLCPARPVPASTLKLLTLELTSYGNVYATLPHPVSRLMQRSRTCRSRSDELYLYISRHSKSPLSKDLINSSALARFVANGILCISHKRITLLTSGSWALGASGSRKDHHDRSRCVRSCTDLLFSSQMSSKIFVYIQVGDLFDQPAGSSCGI